MILTVTLSPAIDKTAECESFNPSEVNRITPISVDFGGKGINVSRAAKKLGLNTYAIGIGFDMRLLEFWALLFGFLWYNIAV